MQALLSNTYTMTFAGTIIVGVLMLTVSLLAFFVLAAAGSSIHGLVILSRKAVTSAFSPAATLISQQPPTATESTNSTAEAASDATVTDWETILFASTADPVKTKTSQDSPRFANQLRVIRRDADSPVGVMPAGRHFKRK